MILSILIFVGLGILFLLAKKDLITEKWIKLVNRKVWIVLLLLNTFSFFLGALECMESKREMEYVIERNTYGEGNRREELILHTEQMQEEVSYYVDIEERKYSATELDEIFAKAVTELDTLLLGDNESFDYIDKDLNYIKALNHYGIKVEWVQDNYQVINGRGEINAENCVEEGTLINLTGVLSYGEEESFYIRAMKIFPPPQNELTQFLQSVDDTIEEINTETVEMDIFRLPESVDGKPVKWEKKQSEASTQIAVLGLVISILLVMASFQKQKKLERIKKDQMILDYPEILGKMVLLMGAGMTVKNSWKKIVQNYLEQIEVTGKRYAYEEMKQSYHELCSQVSEIACYEQFGKRCELASYRKFATLLSGNLRKGAKGLSLLLQREAKEALEERKARAIRLGEEAGTKLLLPMMIMLVMVLFIVMIPAILSMKM